MPLRIFSAKRPALAASISGATRLINGCFRWSGRNCPALSGDPGVAGKRHADGGSGRSFDVTAVDTLQQVCGLAIEVVTAPERDILNCLDLYYHSGDTIGESIDKVLKEKEQEHKQQAQPLEVVLSRMANKTEDAPVIRLVQQIITRAVYGRASDIHFEPEEGMIRVRTRVDGVLTQDVLIPKTMQSAVTTRMKILADLDLTETRVPQDGRATILVEAGRSTCVFPACRPVLAKTLLPGFWIRVRRR